MVKKLSLFMVVMSLLIASFALAGDKYVLDEPHSSASFSVKHLVVSTTTGKFEDMTGTLSINEEDLTDSSVDITIDAASVDTDNEKRDKHLRSADFFDVEQYPNITFKSTGITKTDDGYQMTGNLTIKDITREVSFPFTVNGFIDDPWGSRRMGASASLTIKRQDFDITWNKALDGGGVLVGDDVKIDLHIEAVKAEEEGTN